MKQSNLLLASAIALALTACGGGGGSGSSGTTTTQSSSSSNGIVTGFGSVIVDGVTYEDSQLDNPNAIQFEDSDGQFRAGNREDVALGKRVDADYKDGNVMTRLRLGSELVGLVTTAASGNEIGIAGQRVVFNLDPAAGPVTYLEGIPDLTALASGDRVEVYGLIDDDSNGSFIRASRIELEPLVDDSGNTLVSTKLTGIISNVVSGSPSSFQIGSITVQVPSSATLNPVGLGLQNGMLVKVFSSQAISNDILVADLIRTKQVKDDDGQFRLRGAVTNLNTAANTFQIEGTTVDFSGVTVALSEGDVVLVSGAYDADTNLLTASSIKTSRQEVIRNSLKGSITNFVDNSSFFVRGTPVDASGIAGLTGLADGVFVEVKGTVSGGTVIASQLEIKSPTSGSRLEIDGTVSSLNTTAQTFVLETTTVNYASAQFEDGTSANLADGVIVEAEGELVDGFLLARKIEFREERDELKARGILQTDSTENNGVVSFALGSQSFSCTNDGSRQLRACTTARLIAGAKVELRYTINGDQFTVTKLELKTR